MSQDTTTSGGTGSSALDEHIDTVCDRFEAAWRSTASGGPPRIEDFLGELPEPGHSALLRELIRMEVYHRCRQGEALRADEYRERFPVLDPAWLAAGARRAVHGRTGPPGRSG